MKKTLAVTLILLISTALFGCSNFQNVVPDPVETNPAVYENSQYGFNFSLPDSWIGYSIVEGKWEGLSLVDAQNGKVVESGPIISIRHPKWTSDKPRQDIPIMVFTLAQWTSLANEEFSVGAAPIPPTELGRNSKYVFALPARYNYAYLTGFEEVQTILDGSPLKPTEEIGK